MQKKLNNKGLVYSSKETINKRSKILIGTPIHESKDYCMKRWLKNVAKLIKETPADLLLVDNSPGTAYSEKVKKYCEELKLNPEIIHFEIWQYQSKEEKIARSREIIRQFILTHGYEAWFSWDSDEIIPITTLKILSNIMNAGHYSIVHPSSWTNEVQIQPEVSFAISLIKKEALVHNGFLFEYPDDVRCENETSFKKKVLNEGGSYIEVYGLIKPILHLSTPIS